MSMRDYKFTLAAGQERSLNVEGDWFHVLSASGDIKIRFDDGVQIDREQGQGGSRSYKRVNVQSPIAQTVTLSLGYGQETDARASVNAVINTTIAPANVINHLPTVTCAPGVATLLAAANANRKELRLDIPESQLGGLNVGGVGIVANQGGFIDVGVVDYMAADGAIYAFNNNAFSVDINILSLERI